MFGLFFNSFLNFFGVHAGYLSATLAGLIPILIVGYMTKKDIRVSTKVIGWFIAIEAGFVALLALYIIIKQAIAGNLSFQPLNPTAATAGWTGFLNALLFAVLAIAAFDIVAPMAEETKTPRRLVPRATIYVTIGAGLYWVFTSFGIVNAVPAKTMAGLRRLRRVHPDLPAGRALRQLAAAAGAADRLHRRVRGVQRDLDRGEQAALRAGPRGPRPQDVRADRQEQDPVERAAARARSAARCCRS